MKPPFALNPLILSHCAEISRLVGRYEGVPLAKPEPLLRKSHRIKTIQASLAIEGNTLSLEQVTALMDGHRVIGPQREILEIQNAIKAYEQLATYKPSSGKSLCKAHEELMRGLVPDAGKWRQSNVGIFHGKKVAHTAPQPKRVPELMDQIFKYLKTDKETHPLILSAIFHYELEFIHPFSDGNGRIGRLWQTLLLTRFHPIFEFTPVESVVRTRQEDYYAALGLSDKTGSATPFIEFSLSTILAALQEVLRDVRQGPSTVQERLQLARDHFADEAFSRKNYLELFRTVSSATASRDLAFGAQNKWLAKTGDKALTRYHFVK